MFKKILVGTGIFIMAVAITLTMVAAAGVAVVGAAVGSVIDEIDTGTVQVIDESGRTETYTFEELLSESGQVEIIGDNGERVTIDMPVVTVQEQGLDGSQVVFGGESGLLINGPDGEVRFNGRNVERIETFDYHHRPNHNFFFDLVGGIFGAIFKLMFWGTVIVAAYYILRNRQPNVVEKTPDSVA